MKLSFLLSALGTYLAAFAALRLAVRATGDLAPGASLAYMLAILGLGASVAWTVCWLVARYSGLLFMAGLYAAALGVGAIFLFWMLLYLAAPLWQHDAAQGFRDDPSSSWAVGYPLLTLGAACGGGPSAAGGHATINGPRRWSNPALERTPLAVALSPFCGVRPRPESSLSLHQLLTFRKVKWFARSLPA